jgi:glutathione-specific gamma-glutamylcyclotransferase
LGASHASHRISRDALRAGIVRAQFNAVHGAAALLTDAEHRHSIAKTLAARPDSAGDVWLFAYGSLMWNPIVRYREKRIATVRGHHRRFCMWTRLYRGSPENPGLVLGLVPGGSCRGVAYRIAASEAREELELIWRREMINGGYHPTWLRIITTGGRGWAIGFVSDKRFIDYAGLLPEDRIAAIVGGAKGYAGSCAAYLFDTAAHLDQLGIRDPALRRIRGQVKQIIERNQKTAI